MSTITHPLTMIRQMATTILLVISASFLAAACHAQNAASALSVASYKTDAGGVTFTLSSGVMRVAVCQDDIIQVEYSPASSLPEKESLVVSKVWGKAHFKVQADARKVTIATGRLYVEVDKNTGAIAFTDLKGNVILAEDSQQSKSVTPAVVSGVNTNTIEDLYQSPPDEALYGLGQHQNNILNLKGSRLRLLNANTEINIPVLVSNKGYGILWDNASPSDFSGDVANNTEYRYVSQCGNMVDYYFFYGPKIDKIVSLYRTATGAAPLFPKWSYGLFQSKYHYTTQAEILAVKDGYRSNNIPVDCIVQDWDYWDPYAWGSHIRPLA